jgi:cell division transport system permease protein
VFALREALLALVRHPVSTLATLVTALVSFTLLTLVGLLLWNLEKVVGSLEREVEIAVFLKPGENGAALFQEVSRWPEVASVRYIPRDQALKTLEADFPYLKGAAGYVENPLPDTLVVRPKAADQVAELAQRLLGKPVVDRVDYGGRLTLELLRLARGVRLGAVGLILLLILNTFFSVMGTIRLSIENRRQELAIMQLVGATRGTVLLPFLFEGVLLTLSAALLAFGLALFAYRYLVAQVRALYPFIPALTLEELKLAAAGLFVLAFFLGFIGAWLSSRAQLKEVEA